MDNKNQLVREIRKHDLTRLSLESYPLDHNVYCITEYTDSEKKISIRNMAKLPLKPKIFILLPFFILLTFFVTFGFS